MTRDAANQIAADLRHFSPSRVTVSNLKLIGGAAITTILNFKKIEGQMQAPLMGAQSDSEV
jgi:hypothetical protein